VASKVTSRLRIAGSCVLIAGIVGVAVAAGFHAYQDRTRAAAEQRVLADFLHVERLPDSARDIECIDIPDSCEPHNFSTTCFVRIEPRDFELLASQANLHKNEDTCPENFSETHQMGVTVGPSFKINEEHWGGTENEHVAVYPDAAHSQFVAVLTRPPTLRCMGPASVAAIVRHGDGQSLTAGTAERR
jgi:hypothetical protein